MKRVAVVLAVVIGLALVGTVYAQKLSDTAIVAEEIAKGKDFRFAGVVKSVDVAGNSIVVATQRKGDVTFRLDYAKFEGEYTMADNVKGGDMVIGRGTTVQGQNWVRRMTKAAAAEKADLVTVTSTVTALDLKTRVITLRGPKGDSVTFRVGDQVKNLPQVKVGDKVVMKYYQSLAVRMAMPGEAPVSEGAVTASAKPGQMPAGVAGTEKTIVATVVEVNDSDWTVTLRGPDKKLFTVQVQDPTQLDRVQEGEKVALTYTQALAVAVEKAPK